MGRRAVEVLPRLPFGNVFRRGNGLPGLGSELCYVQLGFPSQSTKARRNNVAERF